MLLSLSNSNLKITKLDRIEYEITLSNQKELKNFILPAGLINSINNDPESQSFYYIFSAIPYTNLISHSRKSMYAFSKNLVTEKLNTDFNEINLKHEQEIKYYKQTNREQYQTIKYQKVTHSFKNDSTEKISQDLDDSTEKISQDLDDYKKNILKQKNDYIDDIIQDKDAYIADITQEIHAKDAYIADIIQDKDAYIEEIKSVVQDKDDYTDLLEQSIPFKLCRILDKLTGKTRK